MSLKCLFSLCFLDVFKSFVFILLIFYYVDLVYIFGFFINIFYKIRKVWCYRDF